MPVALTQVELHVIEKLREQELEEARMIQGVMLPAQPLRADGILISHEFQPVMEVGGDYLDYFHLSDGTIGLYVGDVSGKGLPAALYAALAVGTLRGIHKTGMMPGRVVSLLNQRLLLRGIPGRHTAIQYALFDQLLCNDCISLLTPVLWDRYAPCSSYKINKSPLINRLTSHQAVPVFPLRRAPH